MSYFRSLKRILNPMSLKFKLFVLLLLISIIPIAIVSYSSEYFMFRSSTKYSASISSQYVEFVSREISDYLQNLNQSFDNLFTNFDFQKYLDTSTDNLADQAQYMMRFRPIVQNSLQFHPEVLGVLYLDRLGKNYFDSYQKQLDPSFSFQSDLYYQSIFNMNSPDLLKPHQLDYILYANDKVFSYVRPIININSGVTQSWFVIEIHEDKLLSMLSGNQSGQEGQLILYDDSNGATVSNSSFNTNILLDFNMARNATEDKQFLFASNNVEYEASYVDLPLTNWKLVWTAPLSSIEEGVRQTYYFTILIGAISFVFALFIAFPAMSSILRPLYNLKKGMQSLGRGVYVPIPMVNRHDEIAILVQSYNHTLNKLQHMEQEVYLSKIKEKERELLQLQAQINPHFLYNTLEAIESYSVRNNGEAVGEMVESVSKMMRYSVRNDGGWAPLHEELAYIRNFLNIHYYRNGQEVSASFDIDPLALDITVMKLSIQPYIENAIKYGWSPHMKADEFLVAVKIEIIDDYVQISIHDSGMGISLEVLDKINMLISGKGENVHPYFSKHTGIYNAYRRFVLAYGDSAYFHITSSPRSGTLVQFHIPYK